MPAPIKKINPKFTYQEYQAWPDNERWEIIDGEAYAMTPAPNIAHQRITRNLSRIVFNHFRTLPCEPFAAPTDVVLDDTNIVQPDLFIVCDRNKITDANICGVPDLVMEVVSPASRLKDKREKKNLYERFGVREYLLVYPEDELVERYHLFEGRYVSDVFGWDEKLQLLTFPELVIDLLEVFDKELVEE